MDKHPFAGTVRTNTRVTFSRYRFSSLIAAAVGVVLGFGRVSDVAAGRCRKKSARCSRKDQCCSQRCKRGFCYPRRR